MKGVSIISSFFIFKLSCMRHISMQFEFQTCSKQFLPRLFSQSQNCCGHLQVVSNLDAFCRRILHPISRVGPNLSFQKFSPSGKYNYGDGCQVEESMIQMEGFNRILSKAKNADLQDVLSKTGHVFSTRCLKRGHTACWSPYFLCCTLSRTQIATRTQQ